MRLQRPLILASASPRRAALLAQIGVEFLIRVADVPEPAPAPGADLRDWAKTTAARKAQAVAADASAPIPALILAADTVVLLPAELTCDAPLLDGHPVHVLGKPRDAADAGRMLALLSGREHSVLTAFALLAIPEHQWTLTAVTTRVRFRPLSAADIAAYLAGGEPLDKAGAYGIQGRGAVLIAEIIGDYYTIVGLPLAELWGALAAWRVE